MRMLKIWLMKPNFRSHWHSDNPFWYITCTRLKFISDLELRWNLKLYGVRFRIEYICILCAFSLTFLKKFDCVYNLLTRSYHNLTSFKVSQSANEYTHFLNFLKLSTNKHCYMMCTRIKDNFVTNKNFNYMFNKGTGTLL